LNQQQLQIARAALWRQNAAPILTYDDASRWLDNINFCLFLPRHTQLPAPAPSFVEACMGTVRAMPPADAIAPATDLAVRLVDAGRAIPLNLLGAFSEQPDFLITPDVLPWVVAVRGDRQWKTAPTGRGIAPIVLRTWEALDKQGAQTAVELRELLGRELTEAAVLRALIELWTTLRAAPAYTAGQPTRWSLLKDRYAPQLATAANTAQPTALSALLSIYLRSAVAATGEEAEIFLSPLTARSRIRDVVHGMTAARQFGTMSVGTHTLLFVEGSLPDHLPETVPAPAAESVTGPSAEGAAEPTPASPQQDRARREAIRKYSRDDNKGARPPRREFRPAASGDQPSRRPPAGRPFEKRAGGDAKPWQKPAAPFRSREDRPAFPPPPQASGEPSAPQDSLARPSSPRPSSSRPGPARSGPGRPFQKDRAASGRPPFPRRDDRPRPSFGARSAGPRSGPRSDARPNSRFGAKSSSRPFDRPRPTTPRGPSAPHEGGTRPPRRTAPPAPESGATGAPQKFLRPGPGMPRFDAAERASRPSRPAAPRSGPGRPSTGRPSTSRPSTSRSGPGKFGPSKPGFSKPGFSKSGPPRSGPPRSGPPRPRAPRSGPGKFGPAKFSAGPGKPGKFGAAKSAPGKPRPSFGAARRGPGDFAKRRPAGTGAKRTFRPGGPPRGGASSRPGAPPRKSFRKPGAPPGKPRKNRSEDKSSE
jgi:23S rRNA pseudouridine2605 synthase